MTSTAIQSPRKINFEKNLPDGAWSKIQISTQMFQKCRRPSPRRFALTPYYSSSLGLAILLYESLRIIIHLKLIDFFNLALNFWSNLLKIDFFHFFQLFPKSPSKSAHFGIFTFPQLPADLEIIKSTHSLWFRYEGKKDNSLLQTSKKIGRQ